MYQTDQAKILTGHTAPAGYARVSIPDDSGNWRHEDVHRLVALAFVSLPPPPEYQVHHKDHDKQNNQADNLLWVTASDNVQAAVEHYGRWGGRRGKLTDEDLAEVFQMLDRKDITQRDIARKFGLSEQSISAIKTGSRYKKRTTELRGT